MFQIYEYPSHPNLYPKTMITQYGYKNTAFSLHSDNKNQSNTFREKFHKKLCFLERLDSKYCTTEAMDQITWLLPLSTFAWH